MINLINQGPEYSAFTHFDNIHADRRDCAQVPVLQSVRHYPLDGVVNHCPSHGKTLADLLPTQQPRPLGQEQAKRIAELILATDLWRPFHLHTTTRAIHSARPVKQKHHDDPDWNELVTAL